MANNKHCKETLSKLKANKCMYDGMLCSLYKMVLFLVIYISITVTAFKINCFIFLCCRELGNMKNDSLGLNVVRVLSIFARPKLLHIMRVKIPHHPHLSLPPLHTHTHTQKHNSRKLNLNTVQLSRKIALVNLL